MPSLLYKVCNAFYSHRVSLALVAILWRQSVTNETEDKNKTDGKQKYGSKEITRSAFHQPLLSSTGSTLVAVAVCCGKSLANSCSVLHVASLFFFGQTGEGHMPVYGLPFILKDLLPLVARNNHVIVTGAR